MVGPEDKSLSAMIAKMEEKRAELLMELEKVQEWLSQVDAVFTRGKAIIGEESISTPAPVPSSADNKKMETISVRISESARMSEAISSRILRFKPDAEKTHPEKIRQIFQEFGSPLSIPQIDAKFYEKGWPIKGNNRRQIIRNALVKRSAGHVKVSTSVWFVNLGDKTWDLVERVNPDTKAQGG
jgi:hypothetical protein